VRFNLSASRRTWHALLGLLLLLSAVVLPDPGRTPDAHAEADPRATTGEWGPIVNWGIFGKHMSLMANGKILAWPTGQDAFVWDPETGTKTPVPANFGDLHCAAQTQLADGRILVAGGVIESPHDGITVTAIFDPATYTWTNAAPMHYARWYGTSTTLPDGRVLVTSGDIAATGGRALIPEVYDPVADTWTLLPATASKDLGLYPQMFVLPNGKAYDAGTKASTYVLDVDSASPGYGKWANGPTNAFGSSGYAESSAMYAPGKIIRSGGGDPSIANAAIVDMTATTPQWKQISPMHFPRRRHNMVLLADGEVMAVGGTRSADDVGGVVGGVETGAVYEGEIWDPATEQWSITARMTYDRMYHSAALLLPDGRVLTAGGENNGRLNAQIFSPPYLFKGQRPAINSSPATLGYGQGFSLDVTTDGSDITGVALIRPAAVTHAFDHNQRYVPLTFSQAGNTLSVTAPPNANYAPPGNYMLVVKDSKGVPSVAKWVRVDSAANLTPGTITGKVTDSANGNPLEGVSVSYSGGSTTTDANGDYTLANVNPGEVLVSFAKSGYATIKRTQAVGGGATVTLNVALSPPGSIAGKVTDSDSGEPIAGAIVTYSGGTATAGADGSYAIDGLPAGDQKVTASAPGYNSSAELTVGVPANGTAMFDIQLTPKPTYIAGEVRDKQSNDLLAGVTVSAGGASTTTDATGRYLLIVPPGSYDVTFAKAGYVADVKPNVVVTFGAYTAVDFFISANFLAPVADSYVRSSVPNGNYGTANEMRVQNTGSVSMTGYLRFDVTGLTRPVQSAKLLLYVTNASAQAGSIYLVGNNYKDTQTPWTESGLTFANAPKIGDSPLSSLGAVGPNSWVEYDVTAALAGNGTYSFALKSASTDDVRYSTKEGANGPQLVIDQAPEPSVDSFAPQAGLPGTEVTITGANFAGVAGVTFNGTPAGSFMVDSATQIRAVVPIGAASGKIGVVTTSGTFTSAGSFTVNTPPAGPSIAGFSPLNGPAGTEVTISGANFAGVTGVSFGDKQASSFTVDSATQIRAVVPAGAAGGKVTVITSAGQASSEASFVVSEVPPHQVFVPLAKHGGGASASSAKFRALTNGWADATGAKFYICLPDAE
jgi:hypothetical protein